MTKEETKALLKLILLAYPTFEVTPERVDLWAELLADAAFDQGKRVVKDHIKVQKFAPTIAEIRAGAVPYNLPPEDPQVAEVRRRREQCNEPKNTAS